MLATPEHPEWNTERPGQQVTVAVETDKRFGIEKTLVNSIHHGDEWFSSTKERGKEKTKTQGPSCLRTLGRIDLEIATRASGLT
jgi:hypothetical protein